MFFCKLHSGMSVFADFQKAWAERFPGSEVPKVWEDDVRSNLTRHRQKVATLKEELAKEEFYVEHLEHLLAEVDWVKKKPFGEGCVDSSEELAGDDTEPSKVTSDNRELSSANHVKEIEHSDSKLEDCNSYVTVIEVGGTVCNTQPASDEKDPSETIVLDNHVDTIKENSEVESPTTSLQQKKKPPAPPKKPRKSIPIQAVPPVKKTTDVEETLFENLEPKGKVINSVENELSITKIESILVTKSNATGVITQDSINDTESYHSITSENSDQDVKITTEDKNVINSSTEQITDFEEENIYDTVAGEDVNTCDRDSVNAELDCKEASTDSGDYIAFSEIYGTAPSMISKSSHPIIPERQYSTQKSVDEEESPEYATYMNIDYFLQNKAPLPSQGESDEDEVYLARSFSSEAENDANNSANNTKSKPVNAPTNLAGADDVFEMDSGMYSSSVESASFLFGPSTPPPNKKNENELANAKNEADRLTMYKCMLSSIVESEVVYVECLNMLLQYMKALKCSIGTPHQLLCLEDFNVIFYRIPELHSLHQTFLHGLESNIRNWDGTQVIGEGFKILASKLGVYGSFLQNYSRAIETVRKCSVDNSVFSGITKSIKLKALQGQATNLEDLLHKPVARVQKNALVLHDLLRYTPENHPDYKTLKTALKMTQCFLNDINVSATESMFPVTDRAQRHLVKNSFIVELSEGHRKLRHLFLFSDVIVCAKYKPSTRQKFTFEVKWFISLSEVVLTGETDCVKENSPFDILSLKSRASNVRDQILKEEKGSQRTKVSGRNIDKHKKKLAELEAQLVLASPNLVFKIGQKMGKTYIFFLSSEFEKAQWIEAISILQASAPASALPISPYELQAWITSCRKHFGTNLGSFLLRSGKDEDLLVGDLYLVVHRLHGLSRPSDVYLCFEVDSYGHFFNKAKTKICSSTLEPVFDQDFIIELEGAQTLRILCYENHTVEGTSLRGKGALELSRSWLTDKMQEKAVSLQDLMLTVSLKFEPPELSLRRIPSSKSGGVFGVKIQQVCKKEKSSVPFIVISCIREVEKRGMHEIGIYRVSGSASDVQRLKKSFETNVYEAEQLMKEVDIHSVTGLFKMYLRELPEALFTDALYQKFFHAFSLSDQEAKKQQLLLLFNELPEINQGIIEYFLDHMIRINQHESTNKMSLHNLATVFGPTLLRPGSRSSSSSAADLLTAGTVDVMAQAGIFYFFLKRRAAGLSLKPEPHC